MSRWSLLTIGLAISLVVLFGAASVPPAPIGAAASGAAASGATGPVEGPGSGPVAVFIELDDEPVVVAWQRAEQTAGLRAAGLVAQAQGSAVLAAQSQIEPLIAGLGGQILYSLQRTLNGIAAEVPADRLDRVRALPGVRSVRPLALYRPANAQGVPLIGAPELWGGLTGLPVKGENLKIAVVDSGVDYLHTDFGGSGLAGDYARNDTTVITDNVGFPSAKIVGGYDFAGDDYDGGASGDPARRIPRPDPDPMDCADGKGRAAGHGTHVAGSAAGYGVNADGTTYAGPWDATSVPTATMRIGPGSAPLAKLYSVRVFGCDGSSAVIARGIEWAVDPNGDFSFSDRMDVINLSLGGAFGSVQQDPTGDAANNAALAGIIVVAAAGNSGDTFFINGSPSTVDRVISVAASNAGDTTLPDLLRINAPAEIAGQYTAIPARFGPPITATFALTADLALAQPSPACTSLTNPISVTGKIAVIDRGTCDFAEKVKRAEDAGAVAAIVVNTSPEDDPFAMPPDPGVTVTIPSVMIRHFEGEKIKATLALSPVNGTIDSSLRDTGVSLRDTLGDFTSRGPQRGPTGLKPDVSAPGVEIFSAKSFGGAAGTSKSGTSMATPHVAGAMALLRQLRPDWSAEELKALLMNTAAVQTRTTRGFPNSPSRQGAGRVVLPAAATSQVVAYNADRPGAVSVSFGSLQVVGSTVLTGNVRVVNKGATEASYTLGVAEVVTASGVSLVPLSDTVTVRPGGSVTVPIRLSVDASELSRDLGPATSPTRNGQPRQFLTEYSGYLTLAGPSQLKVPFYADVRPASTMRSAAEFLGTGGRLASGVVTLTGTPVASAAYDPLVWALELQQVSPPNSYTKTTGLQRTGDVRYIGVGTDFAPGGNLEDATIYFGVATYAPLGTPIGDATFSIGIETRRGGTPDFIVSNAAYAPSVLDPRIDADDVFIAKLEALSGTQRSLVNWTNLNGFSATVSTAPFSSTVMVLPVRVRDLKLRADQSRFTYQLYATQVDLEGGGAVTYQSAPLTFDPAAPAVRASGGLGGAPVFVDRPGTAISVTVDPLAAAVDQPRGLLLLHHLNTAASQAEAVLSAPATYLPFLGRSTP